ncbi:hypothetical protein C8T65DRAFT_728971 [Cerioporus squamosus]|nr:hypothetical protein C8T65DRAFT_728971 [Cerioporus squamosus]
MSHGKQFTLYLAPNGGPNGWKVAFLLEELGLSYESIYLNFEKNEQKRSPHVDYNPNGRIPTIIDHKNEDFVLWESNAILLYLVDKYDTEKRFTVADEKEKHILNQWLFFQASGQGPYFGQASWFMRYHPEKVPSAIERYQKETQRVLGVLEEVLAKSPSGWLMGGQFTIADLSFYPWNQAAVSLILKDFEGGDLQKQFPTFWAWHEKISARDSVKKLGEVRASLRNETRLAYAKHFVRSYSDCYQRNCDFEEVQSIIINDTQLPSGRHGPTECYVRAPPRFRPDFDLVDLDNAAAASNNQNRTGLAGLDVLADIPSRSLVDVPVFPVRSITMLLILYTLSAAAVLARAASPPSVSVSYPLEDQLAPIARIHSPFNWSFSPDTFVSDSPLSYSASTLPTWLSLDPTTRTLSGTPSEEDEGNPEIVITASDSSGHASSSVTLCVTPYPGPELSIPVEQQFVAKNPSLSSVFLISNNSALHGDRPALRIPPKWSFSIGFDYGTFSAKNSLYYAARQTNGSDLPKWIDFNERAMTFNGVTPPPQNLTGPLVVSLVLHASDQKGYSASSVAFDIVVAAHELSLASNSLPTINVTAAQPFLLTLNSAVDFSGVLMDGQPVSPQNITSLVIDTADLESWLRYDSASKTLSGQPPSDFNKGVLPVTITSSVNQTLQTEVTIAAVPSFFSSDQLDPVLGSPGGAFTFNVIQDFSNSTGLGKSSDVELTAAYDPLEVSDYLNFDPASSTLSGTIPANPSYQHIVVTLTAYSHITHSTSHTTLPVSLSSSDFENQHNKKGKGGLSTAARQRLILGLKLTFGVVCGFIFFAIVFAVLRRCSQVPDTAVVGEEAGRAWTDEEKKWYGIGIEVNGEKHQPSMPSRGYGWSEGIVAPTRSPSKQLNDDGLGATLSRVLTRTLSNLSRDRSPLSPGVMKKAEFMGKVKATARIVSDKYRRVVSGPKRPVIGKPTLIMTNANPTGAPARTDIDGLPFTNAHGLLSVRDLRTFDDTATSHYTPSGMTSLVDSPTSSTDARSIPRRRADFAPPKPIKNLPQARLADAADLQSMDTLSTRSSTRTHEAEAVIQHATRATSVRSGVSGYSFQTSTDAHGQTHAERARPRLVPFTSATRVPVPKLPSSFFSPDPAVPETASGVAPVGAKTKRVVSQMAKVFRGTGGSPVPPQGAAAGDELRAGIEYVRALGDDGRSSLVASRADPSPAPSAMSFSSLESSHQGHANVHASPILPLHPPQRMLARTGERFKFSVPLVTEGTVHNQKKLDVRLVSGRPLPKFIRANAEGARVTKEKGKDRRVVDLWGVPVRADVGEYSVGVYDGKECVGRVIVEVVERKSG